MNYTDEEEWVKAEVAAVLPEEIWRVNPFTREQTRIVVRHAVLQAWKEVDRLKAQREADAKVIEAARAVSEMNAFTAYDCYMKFEALREALGAALAERGE